MKTKASKTPTQFLRWQTMGNPLGSTRIYRVIGWDVFGGEGVQCIFIGNLEFGKFTPFLGKTTPKWKKIGKYVQFVNLI